MCRCIALAWASPASAGGFLTLAGCIVCGFISCRRVSILSISLHCVRSRGGCRPRSCVATHGVTRKGGYYDVLEDVDHLLG
jgi:hypothetical protein